MKKELCNKWTYAMYSYIRFIVLSGLENIFMIKIVKKSH